MMTDPSPARVAALAALCVGLIAVVIVIGASLGGGDDGTSGGGSQDRGARQDRPRQGDARIYVVKPGDSLSVISEKTGVGVETLQRLNPEIDPQVLRSGERVRLR
jgi:hypothetical protein